MTTIQRYVRKVTLRAASRSRRACRSEFRVDAAKCSAFPPNRLKAELQTLTLGRVAACVGLAFALAAHVEAREADTAVTPGASPEVQSLLAYFSDIYGKKILSGQQEGRRGTNEFGFELTHIKDTTGELPALLGLDFIACTEQSPYCDSNHQATKTAIDWYTKRGGIVTFCWHWYAPMGEPAFYTKDTKFDLSLGVTEGTAEYSALVRDLDSVAEELKLLRDARVPVLWRPIPGFRCSPPDADVSATRSAQNRN